MAVADITVAKLLDYIHEDPDDTTLSGQVGMLRTAAIAYIRSYTNQDDDYLNEHDEFDPVVYVLVADMYDTRSYVWIMTRLTHLYNRCSICTG